MYAVKVTPSGRRASVSRILSLAEFEHVARRVLPPALFHYVTGASEDEVTHRRNLRAIRQRAFLPRVLVDVSRCSTRTELFGVSYRYPFGIAPMGSSRLIAPDGDVALARAAARAEIPFILSGASLTPMEQVRAAGATSWFQAYIPGEADRVMALVDRVEAAGFDTFVITADTAVHPKHERADRNGFQFPFKFDLGIAMQGLSRPGWLWRVLLRDGFAGARLCFENMDARRGPPIFSSTLVRDIGKRDALYWLHVEMIRRRWKGKLIIKGVLASEDAVTAEKTGVDGIIVSNHGGRQIDCAASSLDALERIAERGTSLSVMYDGGIRRGSDVLKAIKLGAKFVFVGRPMLLAAAAAGEAGVAHAIDLLGKEIDLNMALLGLNTLEDLKGVVMLSDAEIPT